MNKVKLFPHQQKALEMTRGMNKVAYYLDMGLGKTFVATEKAKELGTNIILVVCQKSKLEDWEEHFNEFYPKYKTIIYKKQLPEIKDNTVLIINYDLIWRREVFKKLEKFTLILDESSYIKSEISKRTKFILKLKPTNTILLSGTPTGGKYEELYSQIKLLGWKISKETYWNDYIKFFMLDLGGFKKKKVTGYKNVEHLKQMLWKHGAIFMKTVDVIELPETISYEIKTKNIPQYARFKKDRWIEIEGSELVGDTSLTKLLYLRQLAGMYNKNKYEKVTELLESTEDRIIIFYNFKYECQMLKEICKKMKKPVSVVNGDTRDLKNYEQYENSITLIQYQAGAMGLNLQKANKIIYFSLTLSSELFEQSKKRTHRLGQQRTCFNYYLITEKSIEEDIFETLKQRKDYTDKLFEENEGRLI
ncbi:SNF2 family DNA or RNA helicase [Clostridium beijerinckii]|uniref:SNF2-related protein n=1 Tax=Clostridium beijerinckii TaxID=1520 RepID=UPI0014947532|nr:DEAD/DEAH box helicase [Clostridium beijerinckii]NOW86752.1 SNF2 family DNA or RNA helicase [Clostridium beijerinckii]